MEKIEIGKIVKPQGIHGDEKVVIFADTGFDVSALKEVFVGKTKENSEPMKIEKCYALAGGIAIKFDKIADRNIAETYRGALVFADKSKIDKPEGSYFIADIMGKTAVLASGKVVGKIVDVQNFGSADIFYIKGQKMCLVSHKKGLICSVDKTQVVLDDNIFAEVSVYED
jgi:16S rRNA processing protein RimM